MLTQYFGLLDTWKVFIFINNALLIIPHTPLSELPQNPALDSVTILSQ